MNNQRAAFVLEEAKLRSNLALIQSVALAADVEIILALKAYAFWATFPIVKEYLPNATASSLNEARLVFDYMQTSPHIYAPAYLPEQFENIIQLASHLTFNSLQELDRYRPLWEKEEVSIGLRINPEYSPVQTALYNPGDPSSRLGETLPNLPTIPPTGLAGLHSHVLCESTAEDTAELIRRVEQQFGHYLRNIHWWNLGGGHLMTKEGYDLELLTNTLKDLRNRYPHLKIILEPGSAIAWQAGYLRARVLDIVENYGQR
ncbi:MAG: carboxynorspermidine decarboxylase, partial [Bacteroidota bacterium]